MCLRNESAGGDSSVGGNSSQGAWVFGMRLRLMCLCLRNVSSAAGAKSGTPQRPQ